MICKYGYICTAREHGVIVLIVRIVPFINNFMGGKYTIWNSAILSKSDEKEHEHFLNISSIYIKISVCTDIAIVVLIGIQKCTRV